MALIASEKIVLLTLYNELRKSNGSCWGGGGSEEMCIYSQVKEIMIDFSEQLLTVEKNRKQMLIENCN